MGRLFTIRSFWDLFALPALAQWSLLPVALLAYLSNSDVALGAIILLVYGLNFLAILTPLATYFGSKRHDHLTPGTLYHIAALLFGPLVGLHYLLMTRDGVQEKRSDASDFSSS